MKKISEKMTFNLSKKTLSILALFVESLPWFNIGDVSSACIASKASNISIASGTSSVNCR